MIPLLVAEESEAWGWVWLQMGPVGVGAPSGPSPAGCWVAANENLACLLHLLVSPPLSEAPLTTVAQGWNQPPGDRWRGPETVFLWAGLVPRPLTGVLWLHVEASDTGADGSGAASDFVCPQVGHANSYKNEYVCVPARTHTQVP